MQHKFSKGYLAVILATAIWGCTTVIYVLALRSGASPLGMALSIQGGIAFVLLVLTALNFKKFKSTWVQMKPFVPLFVLTSIVFLCRDLFFIVALQNGSKLLVSVVDALWPVAMVLVAALMFPASRRIAPSQFGLLLLAFTGVAIAFTGQNHGEITVTGPLWAYGVALLGALSAGIEVNLFRYVRERTGVQQTLADIFYLSAFIRLPLLILAPFVALAFQPQIIIPAASLPYILILLVAWTCATLFFMYGVCSETAHKIGVVAYISPVLNIMLLAYVFPEERLTVLFMLGAGLVVGANIIMALRKAN